MPTRIDLAGGRPPDDEAVDQFLTDRTVPLSTAVARLLRECSVAVTESVREPAS
ncbi:hypothetical protein [Dietzia sp. 179-F 9C3 NHS]|uniref:hypothetical protein n=1 Tax=Dietzia sp. 179-F 9C3 NHS TaxID=3374295 RepID=UPI0038797FC6